VDGTGLGTGVETNYLSLRPAPGRVRTANLQFRRLSLYPVELRVLSIADDDHMAPLDFGKAKKKSPGRGFVECVKGRKNTERRKKNITSLVNLRALRVLRATFSSAALPPSGDIYRVSLGRTVGPKRIVSHLNLTLPVRFSIRGSSRTSSDRYA
jgi:hypothetical protein